MSSGLSGCQNKGYSATSLTVSHPDKESKWESLRSLDFSRSYVVNRVSNYWLNPTVSTGTGLAVHTVTRVPRPSRRKSRAGTARGLAMRYGELRDGDFIRGAEPGRNGMRKIASYLSRTKSSSAVCTMLAVTAAVGIVFLRGHAQDGCDQNVDSYPSLNIAYILFLALLKLWRQYQLAEPDLSTVLETARQPAGESPPRDRASKPTFSI